MAGHAWYVGHPRLRLVRSIAQKCDSTVGGRWGGREIDSNIKFPDDGYCFP